MAITGDGVRAVWGMSDPDCSDNDPPAEDWAAEGRDYGMSWSAPQRIGDDCRKVNDVAATLDGWLVISTVCNDGSNAVQPEIATRGPAVWSLERLPGVVWYFTDGAVAIADDNNTQHATAAFLSGPNGQVAPPRLRLGPLTLAVAGVVAGLVGRNPRRTATAAAGGALALAVAGLFWGSYRDLELRAWSVRSPSSRICSPRM